MGFYLKGKLENWLLYSAGALFIIIALLFLFIVDIKYLIDNGSRSDFGENISNIGLLISGVVFAPIFEEIAFRSYLTGRRLLIKISAVFFILYMLATGYNPVSILLAIIFVTLYLVNVQLQNVMMRRGIIVINSLLFSVIHYKTSDFESVSLITPMLFQLSVALILSWIIINYSIVKAIIFHALWNGFFIGCYILFPDEEDTKSHIIRNNGIVIEWNQNQEVFADTQFRSTNDSIIGINVDAKNFYQYVNLLDSLCQPDISPLRSRNKYDIKIYRTNDSIDLYQHACEILLESKLIKTK